MFRQFFHFLGILLYLLCFLFCPGVVAQTKCINCGWEVFEGGCTNPRCRKAQNAAETCKPKPDAGRPSLPMATLGAVGAGGSAAGVDVVWPMQNLKLKRRTSEPAGDSQTTGASGACAMLYSSQLSSKEILDKIPSNELLKQRITGMGEEEAVTALLDHIISNLHAQGVTVTRQEVINKYIRKKAPVSFKQRLKPLLQQVQAKAVELVYCTPSVAWLRTFRYLTVKHQERCGPGGTVDELVKALGKELKLVKRIGNKGDSGTVVMNNVFAQLCAGKRVVVMIQYVSGEPELVTLSPKMNDGAMVSVDFAHAEGGVHNIAAVNVHFFLMNLLTIDHQKKKGYETKAVAILRKWLF